MRQVGEAGEAGRPATTCWSELKLRRLARPLIVRERLIASGYAVGNGVRDRACPCEASRARGGRPLRIATDFLRHIAWKLAPIPENGHAHRAQPRSATGEPSVDDISALKEDAARSPMI